MTGAGSESEPEVKIRIRIRRKRLGSDQILIRMRNTDLTVGVFKNNLCRRAGTTSFSLASGHTLPSTGWLGVILWLRHGAFPIKICQYSLSAATTCTCVAWDGTAARSVDRKGRTRTYHQFRKVIFMIHRQNVEVKNANGKKTLTDKTSNGTKGRRKKT